ncbi:unnamed protein product [Hymenolepis diminuta]|uniref:Serine/arginine repetitive matrix protein 1-like n=1 Tax=Hymenolepis diminuta TaxID=6216 RepID=A0A0R3SCP1_HYMDI|nr:unnamed protein product [Hymenolepis diminuta]VUZ55518.1 unnamed protein product [Hymenolepis diminuta]
MIGSKHLPTRNIDQDEGELDSEDDMKLSSSEGYTSDGDSDSNSGDRSNSSSPPVDETPWERGLRLAREHTRKSKLLRETDADLEDKKFNLAVVAPDLAEDGAFADICDMGRSNPSDTFWINYHKLSIIGATQLTCKRTLPCDLDPPSQKTIIQWRRSLKKSRHRSSSVSSPSSTPSSRKSPLSSSVSSNFGSRSSSLSSLAGSIYLAVPDLLLAGDSDAENSRRRRRKRSGSSSSSRSSSRSRSRSSSPKPAAIQKAIKGTRGSYSASSRSRSPSQSPRNRVDVGRRASFTRGRLGGGIGSYGDQQRQPPISGYHYQQTSFNRGGSFRDSDNGPNYGERRGYGDSGRWREPSDRSPELPPMMPSERPVKRSWAADPPRQRGPDRQRSPPLRQVPPPPPPQSQRSRRSRSRSNEESEDRSTYANASWSQSRGRQSAPKAPPPVPSQLDRSPVRSGLDSPPRKRPVPGPSSRRKSRSPFADSYFSNPPLPSAAHPAPQPAAIGDNDLASSIPFEQTVPLLAGAVNPAAPTNPSRPGVKLTIAPRIRVGGNALVERPAPAAPSTNYPRMTEGSPVSSTSSSPPAADRRQDSSMRRQGAGGYTAVSPGGFDSPPPSKSQQQQQRPVSRARGFDQSEDQSRMRGRGVGGHGDYGRDRDDRQSRGDFKNDRFSRGGGQSDRYRDRRPPPPSSIDRFDRRGGAAMNDRNPAAPSYDRGRDYGSDSQYGRSRGGRMDSGRGYDRGRHDIDRRRRDIDRRRGGDRDRSRSPFEDRRRHDRDNDRDTATSLSNKEARLDELRKRLAVLDDKITELGGGNR